MPKDAAYWREYRARKKHGCATTRATATGVAQPQPQPPSKSAKNFALKSKQSSRSVEKSRGRVASPEVWERFLALWSTGIPWDDVRPQLPDGTDWGSLQRRGTQSGDVERQKWDACKEEHKRARLQWLGDRAMKAAFNIEAKTTTSKKIGEKVTEVTEKIETHQDAAMARLAAELTAPEIHGKLARGNVAGDGSPIQVAFVFVQRRDARDEP